MSNLETTIEKAINDFDDIKAAIEEQGVDVPYDTDTSQYGNLIRSISRGVSEPMTPATADTDGAMGLVPAPTAGQQNMVLHGDGTWRSADGVSYENTDIKIADNGLTYSRGVRAVKIIGSILWVIDSGVYNLTENFVTTSNHTVYEFTLPKEISNLIPNVNGAYGTTGTLMYFPALAYENTTYTTFNCQSYLKRSAIGETEDVFQIVYTGLSAIQKGSGLCGFHLRMPVLLV